MGEYIKHKNETVKVGTCDDMYYATYQQFIKEYRNGNLQKSPGSSEPKDYLNPRFGVRFRFPFPDEDGTEIGNYEDFTKGFLMKLPHDEVTMEIGHDSMSFKTQNDISTGNFGFEMPCIAGPDWPADIKRRYQNSSDYNEIIFKVTQQKLVVTESGKIENQTVVKCPYCGTSVRLSFEEVQSIVMFLQKEENRNQKYYKPYRKVAARMLYGYIHPDALTF